jgi:hypothetical protein
MQSNDVIEVVTHLLAVGPAKLLCSRMRPFLRGNEFTSTIGRALSTFAFGSYPGPLA